MEQNGSLWPTQSYVVGAYNLLGNQHDYEQIETNPTTGLAMQLKHSKHTLRQEALLTVTVISSSLLLPR